MTLSGVGTCIVLEDKSNGSGEVIELRCRQVRYFARARISIMKNTFLPTPKLSASSTECYDNYASVRMRKRGIL